MKLLQRQILALQTLSTNFYMTSRTLARVIMPPFSKMAVQYCVAARPVVVYFSVVLVSKHDEVVLVFCQPQVILGRGTIGTGVCSFWHTMSQEKSIAILRLSLLPLFWSILHDLSKMERDRQVSTFTNLSHGALKAEWTSSRQRKGPKGPKKRYNSNATPWVVERHLAPQKAAILP